MSIRKFLRFVPVMALLPLAAAEQALDATKIASQLGRSGQRTGDVYKVGFPRTISTCRFMAWPSSRDSR